MHPILFQIRNFTFYTHGLFSILGIAVGILVLYVLSNKQKLRTDYLLDIIIWVVFWGIIGAKAFFLLLYWREYHAIWQIFAFWNGGLVSYGGFIFGAVTFAILLKRDNQSVLKWFDLGVISLSLGLSVGRFGELFAGDIVGLPNNSFLSTQGQFPVPLFEAIWLLMIVPLLFINLKSKKSGQTFLLFGILYSLGRFFLDYLRVDSNILFNLSIGQIFSFLLFSLFLFFYIRVRKEKHATHK